MSRTTGGYLFNCKKCGKQHLCETSNIADEILEKEGKVSIPCIDGIEKAEYTKDELEHWHGYAFDVLGIRVRIK